MYEIFFISYDFAIKGVDNGIGLLEEAIDPTNFLQIFLPLSGMLNNYPKIYIFIFAINSPRDFLTLNLSVKYVGSIDAVG